MTKTILILALVAALGGCASSTQQAVQLPGDTTRSGLQVPPDVGERPAQVAAVPVR